MSTHCPHRGTCPTPGQCAAAMDCLARKPEAGRVYLLAQAPYPYPLRRDTKRRAVYPQGVTP